MTYPTDPNQPPALAPLPYFTGQMPQPKLRGGPKAIAIISIILGAMGLLAIFGLPSYFMDIGPRNPVIDEIRKDHVMFAVTVGSLIIGIVVAGFLLAGGLKSLKLKPAGRSILVIASIVQLCMGIAGTIINLFYTLPKFRALAAQHPNDPVLRAGAMGGNIGALVGGAFLLYYALAIYVMTRPETKAQFAQTPITQP